jgi:phosphatidylglycerol---prolipoprotein diacylglyceryl transferase
MGSVKKNEIKIDLAHPRPGHRFSAACSLRAVHPEVRLLGWEVGSYALLLTMGLAVGLAVALERGRRDGWRARDVLLPALAAELGGLMGAPLWSATFERWPLMGSFDWAALGSGSGLSIVGGLVLGGLGAWVVARRLGVGLVPWMDVAVPGAAAGIAFGRLGCFLNGCCYGRPTLFPIAVVFESFETSARPIGVPLHPTQLYSAAGLLLLAVVLWHLPSRPVGWRAGWFFVGYAVLRTSVELLRADYRGHTLGLPTTAVAAVGLGLIGAVLLTHAKWRGRAVA